MFNYGIDEQYNVWPLNKKNTSIYCSHYGLSLPTADQEQYSAMMSARLFSNVDMDPSGPFALICFVQWITLSNPRVQEN